VSACLSDRGGPWESRAGDEKGGREAGWRGVDESEEEIERRGEKGDWRGPASHQAGASKGERDDLIEQGRR
jgi:hypothetical protein